MIAEEGVKKIARRRRRGIMLDLTVDNHNVVFYVHINVRLNR